MRKHSCILSYSILGVCYLEVSPRTDRLRAFTLVDIQSWKDRVVQNGSVPKLSLCGLQVLLWITILLSSCATASATPEDVSYIARETVSSCSPPWGVSLIIQPLAQCALGDVARALMVRE